MLNPGVWVRYKSGANTIFARETSNGSYATDRNTAGTRESRKQTPLDASRGRAFRLCATPLHNGVNFSVYSRDAMGVELLLFDREDDASPARVVPLDPFLNRSYHYWHIFLPDVQGG